jgi:CheY-like chemotaxis protein
MMCGRVGRGPQYVASNAIGWTKFSLPTMIFDMGPRAHRIYVALRQRIMSGEFGNGDRLPPHRSLAAEFGVAPMTVRQVLAYLQHEGLVSRELGRGTFVRRAAGPVVLVVASDPADRAVAADQVGRVGYDVAVASSPAEALAVLAGERTVGLVLTGIRLPLVSDGMNFIRSLRDRWPAVPVGLLGAAPDDVDEVQRMPESPVLVVPKPFRSSQVEEALRLALPKAAPVSDANSPTARRALRH